MNNKQLFNNILNLREQLENLLEEARDKNLIWDAEPDTCCLSSLDDCLQQIENSIPEEENND